MSGADFTGFYRPTAFTLPTTAQTTIFTATGAYANVRMINLANITGAAVTVTLEWTDSSEGVTVSLLEGYTMPPNSQIMEEPPGMTIDNGDAIKVTAGTANAIEGIIVAAEIAGRNA